MTNAQRQIFVSYSRRDAELIGPIVKLLRTTGTPIFRDEDSIEPGEEWRVAISESIEDALSVLVFWCEHSSTSAEVRREWRQALDAGKRVIPVMLDETPLDEVLGRSNGIPLQGVVRHRAGEPSPPASSRPFPRPGDLRRKGPPGMQGTTPPLPRNSPELTPTVTAPAPTRSIGVMSKLIMGVFAFLRIGTLAKPTEIPAEPSISIVLSEGSSQGESGQIQPEEGDAQDEREARDAASLILRELYQRAL